MCFLAVSSHVDRVIFAEVYLPESPTCCSFLSIERARNAERVQWPNRNYTKYSSKFIIFCEELLHNKKTFISINISFRILKLYVIKILLN